MLDNEKTPRKKIYGFVGYSTTAPKFATREDAEKYNHLYQRDKLQIEEYEVYENIHEYEITFPRETLTNLCREASIILADYFIMPFCLKYNNEASKTNSFYRLKNILTKVNEKLKGSNRHLQDFKEDEIIKIYLEKDFLVEMTAGQCRTLNKIFKEKCQTINDLFAQIKNISKLIPNKDYVERCIGDLKDLYETTMGQNSDKFEMLDDNGSVDKDYLSLD